MTMKHCCALSSSSVTQKIFWSNTNEMHDDHSSFVVAFFFHVHDEDRCRWRFEKEEEENTEYFFTNINHSSSNCVMWRNTLIFFFRLRCETSSIVILEQNARRCKLTLWLCFSLLLLLFLLSLSLFSSMRKNRSTLLHLSYRRTKKGKERIALSNLDFSFSFSSLNYWRHRHALHCSQATSAQLPSRYW